MKGLAVNLDFQTLRDANIARLPEFKNPKGEPAHSKPDGSDWSPADWLMAVTGELGEFANLLKKVRRNDMTLDEARPALAKELADVQTYLDILAFQIGVDLGAATVSKWNEVSKRVDSRFRLAETADGDATLTEVWTRAERPDLAAVELQPGLPDPSTNPCPCNFAGTSTNPGG